MYCVRVSTYTVVHLVYYFIIIIIVVVVVSVLVAHTIMSNARVYNIAYMHETVEKKI